MLTWQEGDALDILCQCEPAHGQVLSLSLLWAAWRQRGTETDFWKAVDGLVSKGVLSLGDDGTAFHLTQRGHDLLAHEADLAVSAPHMIGADGSTQARSGAPL